MADIGIQEENGRRNQRGSYNGAAAVFFLFLPGDQEPVHSGILIYCSCHHPCFMLIYARRFRFVVRNADVVVFILQEKECSLGRVCSWCFYHARWLAYETHVSVLETCTHHD